MRFHHLDTLRFFFAAYVVFGHTIGWFGIATNGGLAVDVFFVLSGFVLTHLLVRHRLAPGRFFLMRFARMWPLHIVTMAAMCLILAAAGDWPIPGIVVLNALMLQDSGLIDHLTLNWPSWSISAEMIVGFFVLYPLALRRAPIAAAAIVVTSLIILLQQPGIYNELHCQQFGVISIGLVRCAFGTSLGYLAYEAYARYGRSRMASPTATIVHIASLCMFAWLMAWPLSNAAKAAGVVVCAAAIFVMAAERSPVTDLLAHPEVRWLGSISFGIYMVHAPILTAFRAWSLLPADGFFASAMQQGQLGPALAHYAIPLAVFSAAVLMTAISAYWLVETPAKAVLLGGFRRQKAAAQPSTS